LFLQEKMAEHAADSRRQFNMVSMGFKGFRESNADEGGDPESNAQAALRKSILHSLVEPPKLSEDIPPARLPTKEEKELIKLSLTIQHTAMSRSQQLLQSQSRVGEGSTHDVGGGNSLISPSFITEQSSTMQGGVGEEGMQSHSFVSSAQGDSIAGPGQFLKGSKSAPGGLNSLGGKRGSSPSSAVRTRSGASGNNKNKPLALTAVNSSTFFGGDSSVLMSSFGGPSLWSIPGERDIYGNSAQQLHSNVPEVVVPPAFSEASLKTLARDNLIDVEGHTILRRLAASSDRVQVYDRSQPTLLVRSPAMSTSVTLPALDSMRKTEIAFGTQKVTIE
jgi:hypothetical protein